MKFVLEDKFNWPLDKITHILANEEIIDFEDLPNVSKRKMIERRWEGRILHKKFEWNVHGQIPKAAQAIISPDKLTFIEQSIWDDDKKFFSSVIIPHYFKNQLNFTSKSQWSSCDGNKTFRRVEGNIEIRIPFIGPLVEPVIVDHFKKNAEKGTVCMKKAFEARIGPPCN